MPIQVKTMRDIWDKTKKPREIKKYRIFPSEGEESKLSSSPIKILRSKSEDKKENEVLFAFAVAREGEEILFLLPPRFAREIEKYYLEYLARKKAFLETKDEMVKAFAEYEKKLGGAGFSKI